MYRFSSLASDSPVLSDPPLRWLSLAYRLEAHLDRLYPTLPSPTRAQWQHCPALGDIVPGSRWLVRDAAHSDYAIIRKCPYAILLTRRKSRQSPNTLTNAGTSAPLQIGRWRSHGDRPRTLMRPPQSAPTRGCTNRSTRSCGSRRAVADRAQQRWSPHKPLGRDVCDDLVDPVSETECPGCGEPQPAEQECGQITVVRGGEQR